METRAGVVSKQLSAFTGNNLLEQTTRLTRIFTLLNNIDVLGYVRFRLCPPPYSTEPNRQCKGVL